MQQKSMGLGSEKRSKAGRDSNAQNYDLLRETSFEEPAGCHTAIFQDQSSMRQRNFGGGGNEWERLARLRVLTGRAIVVPHTLLGQGSFGLCAKIGSASKRHHKCLRMVARAE